MHQIWVDDMAFESINYQKLSSTLNKLDNINANSLKTLKGNLSQNSWGSPVRARIQTAMQAIIDEYQNISSDIKKYKELPNKIKEYQALQKQLNNLNGDLNSYYNKYVYYCKELDNVKNNPNVSDNYKISLANTINGYVAKYRNTESKISSTSQSLSAKENQIRNI